MRPIVVFLVGDPAVPDGLSGGWIDWRCLRLARHGDVVVFPTHVAEVVEVASVAHRCVRDTSVNTSSSGVSIRELTLAAGTRDCLIMFRSAHLPRGCTTMVTQDIPYVRSDWGIAQAVSNCIVGLPYC